MTDYDEQQVQPEPEGVPVGESTEPTEPASDEPVEDGSDDPTFVAGLTEENAVLLLAAAEEEGLDAAVVVVDTTRGGFVAPEEVVSKAKSADSNEE